VLKKLTAIPSDERLKSISGGKVMSTPSGQTLLSSDHETVCLIYEAALKQGYEADYGNHPDGGYWVEIYGCTLNVFSDIPQRRRGAA
jgi:hypothetical protein